MNSGLHRAAIRRRRTRARTQLSPARWWRAEPSCQGDSAHRADQSGTSQHAFPSSAGPVEQALIRQLHRPALRPGGGQNHRPRRLARMVRIRGAVVGTRRTVLCAPWQTKATRPTALAAGAGRRTSGRDGRGGHGGTGPMHQSSARAAVVRRRRRAGTPVGERSGRARCRRAGRRHRPEASRAPSTPTSTTGSSSINMTSSCSRLPHPELNDHVRPRTPAPSRIERAGDRSACLAGEGRGAADDRLTRLADLVFLPPRASSARSPRT